VVRQTRLTVGSTEPHVAVTPPFGVGRVRGLAASVVVAVVEAGLGLYFTKKKKKKTT